MWNLEGMCVSGMYMGEFPVTGVVTLSRVQYGGEVSHHVELETPVPKSSLQFSNIWSHW